MINKKLLIITVSLFCLNLLATGKSQSPELKTDNSTLSFRQNKGQLHDQDNRPRPDIDFAASMGNMNIFVGKGQLHYQFHKEQKQPVNGHLPANIKIPQSVDVSFYRMDVTLVGANTSDSAYTEGASKDEVHYYTPSTGKDGATNVRSYEKITYKEVYPGIDWVIYADKDRMKYDFIVHPGGKVSDIRLQYSGASSLSITDEGGFRAVTPMGSIEEDRPYTYLQTNREQVRTRFVLEGNILRFETSPYQGTLVIDPGVDWATYYGGNGDDGFGSVACDNQGYVYALGGSSSASNIATSGAHQSSLAGYYAAVIAKFDSLGVRQWATYYEGSVANPTDVSILSASSLACDSSGNVFIAGYTSQTNGVSTPGSFQETKAPADDAATLFLRICDAFLVKFDNNGVRKWGTYFGGGGLDFFISIACDDAGNVYAGGMTDSASKGLATTGAHAQQTASLGSESDAIIVKFNGDGDRIWATYFGGESFDELTSIACDGDNNIYAVGSTYSRTGITSSDTYRPNYSDKEEDAFLINFSKDGRLKWSTYTGAKANSVACNSFGHCYIGGNVVSAYNPDISTPGSFKETSGGGDFFLIRFDSTGKRKWGTFYGGDAGESQCRIACSVDGKVYLTGSTTSDELTPIGAIATPDAYQDTSGNEYSADFSDAFIAEFDSTGARHYGTFYGGAMSDNAGGIACNKFGHIYLSGGTNSLNNISTAHAHQPQHGGGDPAYYVSYIYPDPNDPEYVILDTIYISYPGDGFLVKFAPLDLRLASLMSSDTICAGTSPLNLQLLNNGRINYYDSIRVYCSYVINGQADTINNVYSMVTLSPGNTMTVSPGSPDFSIPGNYNVRIWIGYSRSDSSIANDTIIYNLEIIDKPTAGSIVTTVAGPYVTFSLDTSSYVTAYQWEFGDNSSGSGSSPTHTYGANGSYNVTVVVSNKCGSDTVSKTVEMSTVHVSNVASDVAVLLYPNPARTSLTIEVGDDLKTERLSIIDVLGATVYQEAATEIHSKHHLDISKLATGHYILRIQTKKGLVNRSFQIIK